MRPNATPDYSFVVPPAVRGRLVLRPSRVKGRQGAPLDAVKAEHAARRERAVRSQPRHRDGPARHAAPSSPRARSLPRSERSSGRGMARIWWCGSAVSFEVWFSASAARRDVVGATLVVARPRSPRCRKPARPGPAWTTFPGPAATTVCRAGTAKSTPVLPPPKPWSGRASTGQRQRPSEAVAVGFGAGEGLTGFRPNRA